MDYGVPGVGKEYGRFCLPPRHPLGQRWQPRRSPQGEGGRRKEYGRRSIACSTFASGIKPAAPAGLPLAQGAGWMGN